MQSFLSHLTELTMFALAGIFAAFAIVQTSSAGLTPFTCGALLSCFAVASFGIFQHLVGNVQ